MKPNRIIASLLTAWTLLLFGSSFVMAERIQQKTEHEVAATVNGRPIYSHQIKPDVDRALGRHQKYGASTISEGVRQQIQKDELNKHIEMELLVQAGEKISDQELEKKVDEMVAANMAGKDTSSPEGKLKEKEYRQQARRTLLVEGYLATQGLKELRVPEADLRKFYEDNPRNFLLPESVKVSHILITLPRKATPEEIALAKEQSEKIWKEVLQGAKSFEELATKYSGGESAKKGGDLGYINPNFMPAAFEKVAFALKAGEVSEPVQSRHGFHIIKAYDKKPARIQEFAEVKGFLERFLLKKYQETRRAEIGRELRTKAKVEILINTMS